MPEKEIQVRNNKNMIIGWVKDYPDRILAFHYKHGYLGSYSKGTDVTIDERGRIYCYGDGTQDMVRSYDRENG